MAYLLLCFAYKEQIKKHPGMGVKKVSEAAV